MSENILISVALAVYNGEKYLLKQLHSLVNQTLLPYEIIIVDDCSSDSSSLIIDNFINENSANINIRYYKNTENIGVIQTFKKSIGLCKGNYIATCDQDDIWLPGKLQISYEAILELDNNKPCAIFTDLKTVDNEENTIYPSLYKQWGIYPERYQLKNILIDNVIIGCTAFFNKRMQDEISKMPIDIIMHDYWIALIAYSFGNHKFVDEVTILYRSHTGSITSKINRNKLSNLLAELRKRKTYLAENFSQAEKFLFLYEKKLNINDRKDIEFFLSFKNKPFIYKRIYTKFLKKIVNIKRQSL